MLKVFVFYLFLSVIFGNYVDFSLGKIQHGTIDDNKENFMLLDTFVFGTGHANLLTYEIRLLANSSGYDFVIFDDTVGQWSSVRYNEDSLTCSEKVAKITDSSFKIPLTEDSDSCKVVKEGNVKWLICKGYKDFSTKKSPRRYFLHLTNCHGRGTRAGIRNTTYTIHMTNGLTYLEKEFSYDQRFIFGTDLGFLLGYVGILLVGTASYASLAKKHLLHVTYRLFYLSLVIQVLSLFFHCLALGNFASNGHDLPSVNKIGYIMYSLSSVLLAAMLLLVSKGYTITRARLSLAGSIKVTFFALLYAASYLVFFTFQYVLADPRDILEFYGTTSAAGLVVCRTIGFIWTLYGVFFTIKSYPEKAMFYVPFALVFGVWFLTEPVTIYLAPSVLPKMDSACIINGLQWLTAFLGHIYFMVLTMPVSLNKRFPFTLPATKIADMESRYAPTVYDEVCINSRPASARGSVKSTKSCESQPINLPRFLLTDFANAADSGKESTTSSTNEDEITALPSFPAPKLIVVEPAPGKDNEAGSTPQAETTTSQPLPVPKKFVVVEPAPVQPYPLTPAQPQMVVRPPKGGYEIFCVEGKSCTKSKANTLSGGDSSGKPAWMDVLNKTMPKDDLKKSAKKHKLVPKLPKLKVAHKFKKAPSFTLVQVLNQTEKSYKSDTTSPWSDYLQNEQKRLRRLVKLTKLKLPGLTMTTSTPVIHLDV